MSWMSLQMLPDPVYFCLLSIEEKQEGSLKQWIQNKKKGRDIPLGSREEDPLVN